MASPGEDGSTEWADTRLRCRARERKRCRRRTCWRDKLRSSSGSSCSRACGSRAAGVCLGRSAKGTERAHWTSAAESSARAPCPSPISPSKLRPLGSHTRDCSWSRSSSEACPANRYVVDIVSSPLLDIAVEYRPTLWNRLRLVRPSARVACRGHAPARYSRWSLFAFVTAATRDEQPSFAYAFWRWRWTVCLLSTSLVAILASVSPSETSRRISISREVRT